MSDDVTLVCRVRTGHGNLEKSWYSEIKNARPGKVMEFEILSEVMERSWNFKTNFVFFKEVLFFMHSIRKCS